MKANPQARPGSGIGLDRGLLLLIGGVVTLILVGLIAVPLLSTRTPAMAPEGSPDGVVQRFYLAVYDGDWETAHGYLSAATRDKLTVAQLQEAMRYSIPNSQVRTGAVSERETGATVKVTQTNFTDGGLFGGSGEYSSDFDVLLTRENDTWKIISGPFPLPQS